MTASLAPKAGSAIIWRAVQLLAGRGISLGRLLILSLILAPEAFGLLAIGATALELMLAVTDFGMQPALLQKTEPSERQWNAGWTVRFVRSFAVAAAVALLAPVIAGVFDEPGATNVIRLLALRPVLESLASIKTVELSRNLDFRALTLISVPATVVEAAVSIGFAEAIEVWALVAGAVAGASAAAILSYVVAPYRPRLEFDRRVSATLFRFGRWVFATSIVGVVGGVVLQAVVSRRLGAVELGVYYLAMRLAFLPNELVADVVRDVAFPMHAGLQSDHERSARVFRSSLAGMLAIVGIIYGALIAVASSLSAEVLGAGWDGSYRVIQILAVVGVIGALADATMPMLEGHGRPELVTVLYGIRSALVVALVWPLANSHGIAGAAAAWLAAEVGVQTCCAVLACRILPRPFQGMTVPLAAAAVASLAAGLVAWSLDSVLGGPVGVFAGAGAGMLGGAAVLGWVDARWAAGLKEDLGRMYPRLAPLLRLPSQPD